MCVVLLYIFVINYNIGNIFNYLCIDKKLEYTKIVNNDLHISAIKQRA